MQQATKGFSRAESPKVRHLISRNPPTTQECRAEWPTGEIGIYAYFEMFIS